MGMVTKSSKHRGCEYESHIHKGHHKGNMFEGEKIQNPKVYEPGNKGFTMSHESVDEV